MVRPILVFDVSLSRQFNSVSDDLAVNGGEAQLQRSRGDNRLVYENLVIARGVVVVVNVHVSRCAIFRRHALCALGICELVSRVAKERPVPLLRCSITCNFDLDLFHRHGSVPQHERKVMRIKIIRLPLVIVDDVVDRQREHRAVDTLPGRLWRLIDVYRCWIGEEDLQVQMAGGTPAQCSMARAVP